MAKVDERDMALGRLYGRSILEVAGSIEAAESILEGLNALGQRIDEDRDLAIFFTSPMVDTEHRAKVLEKSLRGRAEDVLVDAFQVINRKGRLAFLPVIAVGLSEAIDEAVGRVNVDVTTALPITEDQRKLIEASAAKVTGKIPRLITKVDPSILGGLILHVAGTVLDQSVAGDVAKLRSKLLERASGGTLGIEQYWDDSP